MFNLSLVIFCLKRDGFMGRSMLSFNRLWTRKFFFLKKTVKDLYEDGDYKSPSLNGRNTTGSLIMAVFTSLFLEIFCFYEVE